MHTARDIGRTRPDTATDSNRLSGALPPCAHAEPPPDDGTILAMGRRFRSAVDRFTALDRQHAALPPDAPTEPVVPGDKAQGLDQVPTCPSSDGASSTSPVRELVNFCG